MRCSLIDGDFVNSEFLVYRLLARALLDIRIAALDGNTKAALDLADLFHNVPYQIGRIRKQDGDYSEIINYLELRCKQKGLTSWLKTALKDCSKDVPSA